MVWQLIRMQTKRCAGTDRPPGNEAIRLSVYYNNAIDYGKGVDTRLIAWRTKMRNLTLNAESHGYKKEEKVLSNNQGLNMPITEMSPRIEQLKSDRPTEPTPQRKKIDNGFVDMHRKYVLRTRLSYTGLYGKESWPRERKQWEKV
ncbi:MAG TPA: hypothetical protein VLR50_08680 [Desulfobacterales bacterium]|nr:hypothetical protein [Desulfobacterales bacterium]